MVMHYLPDAGIAHPSAPEVADQRAPLAECDEHRPACATSPRPGEPDLHVRFCYGTVTFDYIACRTAAENLLRDWDNSHHPGVSLRLIADQSGDPVRLPCEIAWLTR